MGNVCETAKFAVQSAAVLTAITRPRSADGNNSESRIHVTGPTESAKQAIYDNTHRRSHAELLPCMTAQPIAVRHTSIPADPQRSSGLRPMRSTNIMAAMVNRTLTAPTAIVCKSAESPEWLTCAKIDGA